MSPPSEGLWSLHEELYQPPVETNRCYPSVQRRSLDLILFCRALSCFEIHFSISRIVAADTFFLPPLCEKVSHNPFHRRRLASQQGAGKCNQASARSCRCVFNRPCKSSQVTVMAFRDLLPNFKQQSGCPTVMPKCCQE